MSGLFHIRFFYLLTVIIAVFALSSTALAAWEPPRVFIMNFPVKLLGKQALTGSEKTIGSELASCLGRRLLQRYPCASILTEDAFKVLLNWDRQQSLLGTPDEDRAGLEKILEAFGKAIVIDGSLVGTVSGYNLTLRVMNAGGSNPKISKSIKTKDTSLSEDAFFELCDEIGDDLRLGICTWDGSITLKIGGSDQVNETESHENGSALNSVKQDGLLTLEVTWKGERENREESQSASYTYKFERQELNTQSLTMKGCLTDDGKFVDKPYHSMHRSTSSASRTGHVEGNSASITLNPKTHEFEIKVTIPEIDGETAVTTEDKEDGGCPGVSNQSNDSFKNPGTLVGAQSFAVKDYFNSREGRLKGEKKLEDVALFPYTNKPNEGTISYDLRRR